LPAVVKHLDAHRTAAPVRLSSRSSPMLLAIGVPFPALAGNAGLSNSKPSSRAR
jgi:hypothetical protein